LYDYFGWKWKEGFTLIELSIVLTIIALVVGGVLVGQDLIKHAAIRAEITQIEQLNTACNTFVAKYNYLPGDIPAAAAAAAGLQPRGQYAGEGDGNGVIEGVSANAPNSNAGWLQWGEPVMFWVDLSTAQLIDGTFNTATPTYTSTQQPPNQFLPPAKIGGGNYIYVYSGGLSYQTPNNINYFGLSAVSYINNSCPSCLDSNPGLTVGQAYAIDKKIDDGSPQSGNVTAAYISFSTPLYAGASSGWPTYYPTTAATPGSSTTCYDNDNVGGTPMQYSMAQNGGAGVNCALSFVMQGAAR
jgi:prepilin-type N-terminal cleavage/methylation domain-containing protein